MFLGVSVDLTRGGEEHAGFDTLGKSEHVDRSHGGCFDGFDGVVLVMWGACGTCKVVDLVYFQRDSLGDVVDDETGMGVRIVKLGRFLP